VKIDSGDLSAFVTVAQAKGFRDGARASNGSASGLSDAVAHMRGNLCHRWAAGSSLVPLARSA
jgi:hypothetical protein